MVRPLGLVAAGAARVLGGLLLLAVVLFGAAAWLGGAPPAPVVPDVATTLGGPFRLIDEDGQPVTEATWRGRFALLYFGYRFCPDVCPTELAKMIEAHGELPPAQQARLALLFVTLDPERDDPASLKDYTDLFHPALIGLTGPRAETDAAARAFRVYHARQSEGRDPDAYLLDHSAFTYLLGPDGRTRQAFPPSVTAGQLAAALTRHLTPAAEPPPP